MKIYMIVEDCGNCEERNVACLATEEEAKAFCDEKNKDKRPRQLDYEEWEVGEVNEELKDTNEFKPFEKVLVRNSPIGLWIPALYGKYVDGKHLTSAGWQSECVTYEGNESLLGTNKNIKN